MSDRASEAKRTHAAISTTDRTALREQRKAMEAAINAWPAHEPTHVAPETRAAARAVALDTVVFVIVTS
jgi:hypothetical protein